MMGKVSFIDQKNRINEVYNIYFLSEIWGGWVLIKKSKEMDLEKF